MNKKTGLKILLLAIIVGLSGCSHGDSPSLSNSPDNVEFVSLTGDNEQSEPASDTQNNIPKADENPIFDESQYTGSMELKYAKNFTVDYYEGGYVLLTTVNDGNRFLIIPEGKDIPTGLQKDIATIQRPVQNIYLVAAASMDMFVGLDELSSIKFSGKQAKDWYIPEAVNAMQNGDIVYAGKYSKPDYEMLLADKCSLVIENTMIFHSPNVIEQIEGMGIPMMIEYSNYEEHPLGRVEWVKFYGVLLGCEEKAEEIFDEEEAIVEKVSANVNNEENNTKTIAYFYITSNNLVQVRKSNDYISKMIEIAGGKYIFENLGEDQNKSTLNMQVEEFYKSAKDADIIIYNSSIDGGVDNLDELLAKCEFLKDFKAVKEGNAWCTTNDMYQESLSVGYMIEDLHAVINGEEDNLHYIFRLE